MTAMAATLLLAAALALLGCGPSAGDAAPPATRVEFWAMGAEAEAARALVPAFERRHPGIRVRVQAVPWSAAHEKLLTAFVGDSLPDAFQLGNTWIAELVALGALEPLGARIDAAGIPRDDFFGGVLDAAVIDGETFALPWYADTRLLYYRRDLLAEAGVREAPASWRAWREALRRLRALRGREAHALLLPLTEWELPVILAFQRGAELLREGDRFGDFRGPAFAAAFDDYLSFFREGLAPTAGAAQLANLQQDFAAGWFAAFVSGPWQLGELRRRLPADFEGRWATAPLPARDDDPAAAPGLSIAGGASLALVRGSPRREAAWRWLRFLAEPEQQIAFHRLSGDLPARRSAWHDAALRADSKAAAFLAQLQRVRAAPKIPEWERIASRIARHAEAAVRGEESPAEALAALDRETDILLEKRRWLLARRER
jgi:multiple sugar transport system substrate-binding protein